MKCFVTVWLSVLLFGCSMTRYGKPLFAESGEDAGVSVRRGQTENEVFETYGARESSIEMENRKLWTYKVVEGRFFRYSKDGNIDQVLKRGAIGFIQKPFDMVQISELLTRLQKERSDQSPAVVAR